MPRTILFVVAFALIAGCATSPLDTPPVPPTPWMSAVLTHAADNTAHYNLTLQTSRSALYDVYTNGELNVNGGIGINKLPDADTITFDAVPNTEYKVVIKATAFDPSTGQSDEADTQTWNGDIHVN